MPTKMMMMDGMRTKTKVMTNSGILGIMTKKKEDRFIKQLLDTSQEGYTHFMIPFIAFNEEEGKRLMIKTRKLLGRVV
jgi:preprotein translocase subunit YajC